MKNLSKLLVIAVFFFLLMISFRLTHAQPNVPSTDGPWAQTASSNKGPGNNNGNGGGNGNGNSPCDKKNPPKWCTQNNVPIEGPQMVILMIAGVVVGSVAIKKMKISVN